MLIRWLSTRTSKPYSLPNYEDQEDALWQQNGSSVALCGLAIVFAGLTIAVKQYPLVWWAACLIAVISAMIIVVSNRNGRSALPGILLVTGFGVVAVLVGIIIGSVKVW